MHRGIRNAGDCKRLHSNVVCVQRWCLRMGVELSVTNNTITDCPILVKVMALTLIINCVTIWYHVLRALQILEFCLTVSSTFTAMLIIFSLKAEKY
jgi:hypothetical protein